MLSGVLSPPIIVNSSDVLKTTEYSVQMEQDININHLYIQGGPGKSVAEFQHKIITGSMSFFPRINESNVLESSVVDLINAGQNYNSTVTLTTFLLPYNALITAENVPFIASTNSFVFDTCLVEEIKINAKYEGSVKATVTVKGQVDTNNTSPISLPSDDTNIYRNLTWYDCFFSRNGSQLENAVEVEITVTKEIDQRYFFMVYGTTNRYDSPYSTGVKSVMVSFKIVEHITSLYDVFSYSLGGWIDTINLDGRIGPITFSIPDALYKVSSFNLTSDIIQRTTTGYYKMNPATPETTNFLLTIV
jgi:hypothetical protein